MHCTEGNSKLKLHDLGSLSPFESHFSASWTLNSKILDLSAAESVKIFQERASSPTCNLAFKPQVEALRKSANTLLLHSTRPLQVQYGEFRARLNSHLQAGNLTLMTHQRHSYSDTCKREHSSNVPSTEK